ncbi:LptA/OstA family protein [Roseomonas sp. CECT 9278]|uniref:LptA/OstA family protein n=1 Tax=Roseomonas sp. CECT 9278 TaxID=2845823 RepID=UPI001E59462D|nr:LptA/OstA family protein [Roseomonas sp. CECT 9278]CAH0148495.1 Lipopolysaccharide export system protein LptA [Roseomonas sp. CECT 9278]
MSASDPRPWPPRTGDHQCAQARPSTAPQGAQPQPITRGLHHLRAAALAAAMLLLAGGAVAQGIDLSQGGPVEVTSNDGIEWRQADQVIVARGQARATRGGVTVESDRLIARYRPRGGAGATAARAPADGPAGGGEIWRLEAEGNVVITTATDRAEGDRAVYDMDQAVMVLTGQNLRLVNPDNTLTARDSIEYWSARRMAVARGNAVVVTNDGRRVRADTLVAYFAETPATATAPRPQAVTATATAGAGTTAMPGAAPGSQAPSSLDRVEAFGNVEIRTADEVVRGDRGVYSPNTGLARLLANVRITRGDNTLSGQEAIVNMQTGVARLVSAPGARVQGLVVPQQGGQGLPAPGQPQQQQQAPR